MKHVSVTVRTTGRSYGVFGFSNLRFILWMSDSLVSAETSSSDERRRFDDEDVVIPIVYKALETSRTSPNGELDRFIISRIRLAVVDRPDH